MGPYTSTGDPRSRQGRELGDVSTARELGRSWVGATSLRLTRCDALECRDNSLGKFLESVRQGENVFGENLC